MVIVHFEFIPQGHTVNQPYYVKILRQLHEAVHRRRSKLWPNDCIFHHNNDPAHKALSVKQFMVQKIDYWNGTPTLTPDLALKDFWLFPKINSALKGWKFQYSISKTSKKMWWWHWMLFHNRSSKNVPNYGSIIGLSAQLFSGGTWQVTSLSKLKYTGTSAIK
jgi:hypothetical protein